MQQSEIQFRCMPMGRAAALVGALALIAGCGSNSKRDDRDLGSAHGYGTVTQAFTDLSTCGPSNMALNTARSGLPAANPELEFECESGVCILAWGNAFDLVDGQTEYGNENRGLTFVEASQLSVDLGRQVTFDEVTVWHRSPGVDPGHNIPESVGLEYFDGSAWLPLAFSRSFDLAFPQPEAGFGSYPDVYSFTPAVGSKVRWSFDADGPSLRGAVAVAAAYTHSCALRRTGEVTCWGENGLGVFGNGTTLSSTTPAQPVTGLRDAVSLATGGNHACAARESGEVACWGYGGGGQLGNGSTASSLTPVAVVGLTDAVAVAAGTHSCALRGTGEVMCWGAGRSGQLGNGLMQDSLVPVAVTGLTDAVKIAADGSSTCALRQTGEVACWGDNYWGQLGNGSTNPSSVPVAVVGLTDAVDIDANGKFDAAHSCAVRQTGQVVCWGSNNSGQLGEDAVASSSVPVTVSGLSDAVKVVAGGFEASHSCALRQTGEVSCWGYGFFGQLGNGSSGSGEESPTPVAVGGLTDAVSIAAGVYHNCAVRSTGGVVCWGWNFSGQLGNGTLTDASTPAVVDFGESLDPVQLYEVTVNGCPEGQAGESVSDPDVPSGGSLTTDTEGDGATPADPVETSVTTPDGGEVTIDEVPPGATTDDDFVFLGQQVVISAPSASVGAPLILVFVIDTSLLPEGTDENDIEVFKDGVGPIPSCLAAPQAIPDPCIASRALVGDDVVITILTSGASIWSLAVAAQSDLDEDGVLDGYDHCPETPAGETVNRDGCSIAQLCPCDGPQGSTDAWKNHGQYVSCVSAAARAFRRDELISQTLVGSTVSDAAKSQCGR